MRSPRVLADGAGRRGPQVPGGQAPSSQGVVKKGKAPVSTDVLKVKLPRPQEADLANGLHLMVLEDHRLPQITFQISIPGAGGFYDPADAPGLASFTATMMREGTATRTSEQIARGAGDDGGERCRWNQGASRATTSPCSSISGQLRHLRPTLAADILLNPTFPEEELARFKVSGRAPGSCRCGRCPGFSPAEMFNSGDLTGLTRAARVADRRGARHGHARLAGRVPQGALRARTR